MSLRLLYLVFLRLLNLLLLFGRSSETGIQDVGLRGDHPIVGVRSTLAPQGLAWSQGHVGRLVCARAGPGFY